MLRNLPLKAYLVVMLATLVAAPIVFFWAWPYSRAMTAEIQEVRGRHLLIARNLGAALERYHRDLLSAFEYAGMRLVNKESTYGVGTLLGNLGIEYICAFNKSDRRKLNGVDALAACPPLLPRHELAQSGGGSGDGKIRMTGVEEGADGKNVIYLLRVDRDEVLLGAVRTDYFQKLGKSISFGVKGHAAIIDQHGNALSHPLDDWVAQRRNLSKVSTVKRMLSGEQGVDKFYSPALKDDMIAGFTAVPGSGWGVMVPQPLSELRDKASQIKGSAAMVFLVGTLVAALAACYIAIGLVSPISRAVEAARRMTNDEIDVRIPDSGWFFPKEFRELQGAFNAMAEHIAMARRQEDAAREEAVRANESKTQFLRSVSHELRSPLNAIIGFADLIAEPKLRERAPEKVSIYARDIAAGGRHLLSLTNDLLDHARIEAGKYDLTIIDVDLNELAERAVRFVQNNASERGIVIHIDGADAPNVTRGDERALFQAILNLVSNAVRYGSENGNILVRIDKSETGGASISVIDDGPGIAARDLQRVLRPYERAANDRNGIRGTGLGLPIVCKLAELHGGSFQLKSEEGVGTIARILLPDGSRLQSVQAKRKPRLVKDRKPIAA